MIIKLLITYLTIFGECLILMGYTFRRPEHMRMLFKCYIKEMCQLGVDSTPLVLLVSFFIDAVICIQMKVDVQSPWMPQWTTGYVAREILLLEFAGAFTYLILAGKVGSNIASKLSTMRAAQQIDALDIIDMNPASYLIPPKMTRLTTVVPLLIVFNSVTDIIGTYGTAYNGILSPDNLAAGFQYSLNVRFVWMGIIKGIVFMFIIASVSSFYDYSTRGDSVEADEASTSVVVSSSVLVLFASIFLTPLLS